MVGVSGSSTCVGHVVPATFHRSSQHYWRPEVYLCRGAVVLCLVGGVAGFKGATAARRFPSSAHNTWRCRAA
eukprot:14804601-Alexandrium_andersonii.AAC.1